MALMEGGLLWIKENGLKEKLDKGIKAETKAAICSGKDNSSYFQ